MRYSLGLALVLSSAPALAAPHPAPLTPLPMATLREVAPLLRSGADVALIESNKQGALRQLTTISIAASPPAMVRDVVIHPERYPEFVPAMTRSTVTHEPGGTFLHDYALDYKVAIVDGRHRYELLPAAAGEPAGAVEMYDPYDNGVRHYRWEFVPWGGGTLIVLYGYAEMPRQGLWKRLLDAAPTLETGLALTPQMTYLLSVKRRAETLSPTAPPSEPLAAGAGSYRHLAARGQVVFFRRSEGRLSEISIADRTAASPADLVDTAGSPGHWSEFIPSITKSYPVEAQSGLPAAVVQQSIPLVSWETTWGVRGSPTIVDLVGLEGDLRGTRMRFDVQAPPAGTQAPAQLVMRASQTYDRSSMIFRQLYRIEPTFEYGFDVSLALVILDGIKHHAERLTATRTAAAAR